MLIKETCMLISETYDMGDVMKILGIKMGTLSWIF